ncbi:MAG: ribonuclease P protein component [Acidimicrobiia bacterium]
MIARFRGRHEFARLARDGTRFRCSALWCTWCPDPQSTSTRVAYAIGRAYGPAVRRNRLRRRARSVLNELDRVAPLPPGLLLIGVRQRPTTTTASELTFDHVRRELTELTTSIRAAGPRGCSV